MSLESLPLLHKPPVHEQPLASHQSKVLALHSKGSSGEVSRQDLDSASADAVGRKSPQAYPRADNVTADTSGGSAAAALYMSMHGWCMELRHLGDSLIAVSCNRLDILLWLQPNEQLC